MKLDGLQAGRAVAAIMVVAFHGNIFILPDRLYDGDRASAAFNMGYAGVEFFFVLSGFIMVFAHRRDFGIPARFTTFMAKRIVRIYPIYWIIFAILTVGYLLVPSMGPELARDPVAIATSFLLWPMPYDPIMSVAWTLKHEMLFYLVFSLLILHPTLGAMVFGIWIMVCFVSSSVLQMGYPWDFVFSVYNVLFLLGVAAALTYQRLDVLTARVLLVAGSIGFLAVGLSEAIGDVVWDFELRTICFGLTAAVVVLGLAAGSLRPPAWLTFLGDASYAIYLVHLPALSVLAIVLKKLGAPWDLPPLAMLLFVSLLATGAGAIAHFLIERPVLEWLNARIRKPAARAEG